MTLLLKLQKLPASPNQKENKEARERKRKRQTPVVNSVSTAPSSTRKRKRTSIVTPAAPVTNKNNGTPTKRRKRAKANWEVSKWSRRRKLKKSPAKKPRKLKISEADEHEEDDHNNTAANSDCDSSAEEGADDTSTVQTDEEVHLQVQQPQTPVKNAATAPEGPIASPFVSSITSPPNKRRRIALNQSPISGK